MDRDMRIVIPRVAEANPAAMPLVSNWQAVPLKEPNGLSSLMLNQ